jgi:hypothetical protein
MARIGFKKAKYNKIVGNTYAPLTDTKVPVFEKVIDEKFAPEYNNAELYANDALAECDYSFKKGTLSLTVADDKDELCAELFGNTIAESGEVVSTIEDSASEFGYGHIIPKIVGGVRKYKVEFFPRVKFTEISGDNKTRAESVEFGTTSLTAIVYPIDEAINGMASGIWEKHQTFATLTEAETYLDGLLSPVKDN